MYLIHLISVLFALVTVIIDSYVGNQRVVGFVSFWYLIDGSALALTGTATCVDLVSVTVTVVVNLQPVKVCLQCKWFHYINIKVLHLKQSSIV